MELRSYVNLHNSTLWRLFGWYSCLPDKLFSDKEVCVKFCAPLSLLLKARRSHWLEQRRASWCASACPRDGNIWTVTLGQTWGVWKEHIYEKSDVVYPHSWVWFTLRYNLNRLTTADRSFLNNYEYFSPLICILHISIGCSIQRLWIF